MWCLKARNESFPSGFLVKCVSRRQDILQGQFTKLKPASKAVEGNWQHWAMSWNCNSSVMQSLGRININKVSKECRATINMSHIGYSQKMSCESSKLKSKQLIQHLVLIPAIYTDSKSPHSSYLHRDSTH